MLFNALTEFSCATVETIVIAFVCCECIYLITDLLCGYKRLVTFSGLNEMPLESLRGLQEELDGAIRAPRTDLVERRIGFHTRARLQS